MTQNLNSITWTQAEWADTPETQAAYVAGYQLEVAPPAADSTTREWWWAVKLTASISEYPEVYACGFKKNAVAARNAAEAALKRAVA